MKNFSKGVSSELANVGAKWPERKSLAEAQSLKPSPVFRRFCCTFGIAKAPRASTGVSFSNSRRLILLNFRLSVFELIDFPHRSVTSRWDSPLDKKLRVNERDNCTASDLGLALQRPRRSTCSPFRA